MHGGFIKLIILIIIAAIILGYFGINIRSVMESEIVRENLGYIWNTAKLVWQDYLAKPANFVWGIFYNYIWLSFIENMERLRAGQDPTFLDNVPTTIE